MDTIPEILTYMKFSRTELLESIRGLSRRELTQTPIYGAWVVKDVLAHIIGWDRRTVKILPLILEDRAGEIWSIDVAAQNEASVATCRDKSITEVLSDLQLVRQQILGFITGIDRKEIDRRHQRNDRIITIRSYIIDIMVEHERKHAAEIELWRERLVDQIDRQAIKHELRQARANFMNRLDQLDEANIVVKSGAGEWSIGEVVGHVVDWEKRLLNAARHIHDPSLPKVPPVSDSDRDWDAVLIAQRLDKTWPETYHELRETQRETDDFVAALRTSDWTLRGPFPWPDDQGMLAELLLHMTEHYAHHLADLERHTGNY